MVDHISYGKKFGISTESDKITVQRITHHDIINVLHFSLYRYFRINNREIGYRRLLNVFF